MKTSTLVGIAAALFLCLGISSCDEDSRTLKVGGNEVAYAMTVTRAEAAKIGNYLRDSDWIRQGDGLFLRVSKYKRDYEIQWHVGRDVFVFPDTLAYYRRIADSLSAYLKDNVVSIELYSPEDRSSWQVRKEPRPFVKVGKGVMYYGETVTEGQSEEVAAILSKDPFFSTDERLLYLDRYEEGFSLKLALAEGERNQFVYDEMASWARFINQEAFPDAVVYMSPCDPLLVPQEMDIKASLFENSFDMGRLTLWFSSEVDSPDATRLHTFIENCLHDHACDFFQDTRRVTIKKVNGNLQVAMASIGDLDDTALQGAYEELARRISAEVFARRPVTLRIYDPETWEYKLFNS